MLLLLLMLPASSPSRKAYQLLLSHISATFQSPVSYLSATLKSPVIHFSLYVGSYTRPSPRGCMQFFFFDTETELAYDEVTSPAPLSHSITQLLHTQISSVCIQIGLQISCCWLIEIHCTLISCTIPCVTLIYSGHTPVYSAHSSNSHAAYYITSHTTKRTLTQSLACWV